MEASLQERVSLVALALDANAFSLSSIADKAATKFAAEGCLELLQCT